jgi:hypothetical protein
MLWDSLRILFTVMTWTVGGFVSMVATVFAVGFFVSSVELTLALASFVIVVVSWGAWLLAGSLAPIGIAMGAIGAAIITVSCLRLMDEEIFGTRPPVTGIRGSRGAPRPRSNA